MVVMVVGWGGGADMPCEWSGERRREGANADDANPFTRGGKRDQLPITHTQRVIGTLGGVIQ